MIIEALFRRHNSDLEKEAAYFQEREQIVIEKLRRQRQLICERKYIGGKLGIEDETILYFLQETGFNRENAALVYLIPSILLAWSKGDITQDQSDQIKFIANSYGINSTTEAFTLLEQWLREPPAKRTSEAVLRTIRVKLENSDDEMREKLEKVLLDSSTFLSDTPGEILNFDTKMSEIARIEMNIILNLVNEKNSNFLEDKKVNQELKLNK